MKYEKDLDGKFSTILFFIEAGKYHLKNLDNKLSDDNKPEINEEGVKEILGKFKGLEIGIPVTIEFNKGYAIELYEFYSFISAVMASINNIIDLKCRILDDYSDDFSFSFGRYLIKKKRKELPNLREGAAHKLIIKNKHWIQEINRIRNIIHHRPIQECVLAHLIFKAEKDIDGNIIDKSYVKKYVPLSNNELKEILEFCNDIVMNLENFWDDMKIEFEIEDNNN